MPDTVPSTSPDCVIESSMPLWEVGIIISIRGRLTELQREYLFPLNSGAGDSDVLCQASASFRNTLYLWRCSAEGLLTNWNVKLKVSTQGPPPFLATFLVSTCLIWCRKSPVAFLWVASGLSSTHCCHMISYPLKDWRPQLNICYTPITPDVIKGCF